MDRAAWALAQAALGNPPGAAGIEVSLGGLTLDCLDAPLAVAVAGGGFLVETGARRPGAWSVIGLAPGERLTIRPGPWGSWTCLALAGDLQAPAWLGSRATHAPSGLGGGRIAGGDVLTVATPRPGPAEVRRIPCPVWARPRAVFRCVPGPQDDRFAPETLAALTAGPFRATGAFDRMGLRLAGPALPPRDGLALPSGPTLRGSVQVNGTGVATVLMADHQTTGGYPRIATVIDADLDALAQTRPGDRLRFAAVTPETANAAARLHARALSRALAAQGRTDSAANPTGTP
jgi:allophanate hydrolase